ncbi:3176_t:CDS:2 [Entrophospora sp. SA101]|nr:3176_t:CDS:2 [Entrophospora sp. SA101]
MNDDNLYKAFIVGVSYVTKVAKRLKFIISYMLEKGLKPYWASHEFHHYTLVLSTLLPMRTL